MHLSDIPTFKQYLCESAEIIDFKRTEDKHYIYDSFTIAGSVKSFYISQSIAKSFNKNEKPWFEETYTAVIEPEKKGKGTHGQMIHSGQTLIDIINGPDILTGGDSDQDLRKKFIDLFGQKNGPVMFQEYKAAIRKVQSCDEKTKSMLLNVDSETKEHFQDIISNL